VKVLVACEYSGVVRDAFIAHGHDAMSCDLLPTEVPGPHYQGSVLDVLDGDWDLLIGFPPCTYLTYAGAANWNDEGREELREEALKFFLALYNSPIKRVAIENPRGYACKAFRRPNQEINPFEFGTPERKRICLWLKNLPPLFSTIITEAPAKKEYVRKSGPRAGQIYRAYFHQGKNAHERARFFPSIADAMADQWGAFAERRAA
jgi:hypothetical protein